MSSRFQQTRFKYATIVITLEDGTKTAFAVEGTGDTTVQISVDFPDREHLFLGELLDSTIRENPPMDLKLDFARVRHYTMQWQKPAEPPTEPESPKGIDKPTPQLEQS